MSTRPDLLQLTAFVDGELELGRQLEIEALVRDDSGLREQVDRLRGLREAVRAHAHYHAAPPALRERIQRAATGQPAVASAPSRSGFQATLRRWFAWRPLASALALVAGIALLLNLVWLPGQREELLEQEVIASHVRATLAQRLVDVASSDHHTVKPWLSARLDFSPPVQELSLPATQLLGGRVDYVDGRPVAALVYRHAGHLVDSFVWPATGGDTPVISSSQRGFNLAHWSRHGMVHWVISDLNPTEFADLVGALKSGE